MTPGRCKLSDETVLKVKGWERTKNNTYGVPVGLYCFNITCNQFAFTLKRVFQRGRLVQ